jgi:hypothetical protein
MGFGVFIYSNKSKYEGRWYNGVRHGKGVRIYNDDSLYIGNYY